MNSGGISIVAVSGSPRGEKSYTNAIIDMLVNKVTYRFNEEYGINVQADLFYSENNYLECKGCT